MQKLRIVLIALAALAGLGLILYSGTDRRVYIVLFISFSILLAWVIQFNRVYQFERHPYSSHADSQRVKTIMSWVFAFMCLRYVLDPRVSMLFAIHRHYPLLPFRNLFTVMLYTAVPIISGVAAWTVWTQKASGRMWAIAANVTYILIFIRLTLFFPSPGWWRHIPVLGVGIFGLMGFLPCDEQIKPAPPASASA